MVNKASIRRFLLPVAMSVCLTATANAQQQRNENENAPPGVASAAPLSTPGVPLSPTNLYAGWRVSNVLGRGLVSKNGGRLGIVRNVLFDERGRIEAFLVESRVGRSAEFVSRITWALLDPDALPDRIVADVPHPTASRRGSPRVPALYRREPARRKT